MITLVKFIRNPIESASANNAIITKTLGKTGVVGREYSGTGVPQPKEGEFWYVEVVKERGPGSSRGLFVLKPIQKVGSVPNSAEQDPDIVHLIPGGFDSVRKDNVILVYPKKLFANRLGPNWICSIEMKKNLMEKHKEGDSYKVNGVVIVFDGADDWEKEGLVADRDKKRTKTAQDNSRRKVFKGRELRKSAEQSVVTSTGEEIDPRQLKLPL